MGALPGPTRFADLPAEERARIVDELLAPFVWTGGERLPADEVTRRGQELYERVVRPTLTPADDGKYVAIDVVSGQFEIGDDEFYTGRRLRCRVANVQEWGTHVNRPRGIRFGLRKVC